MSTWFQGMSHRKTQEGMLSSETFLRCWQKTQPKMFSQPLLCCQRKPRPVSYMVTGLESSAFNRYEGLFSRKYASNSVALWCTWPRRKVICLTPANPLILENLKWISRYITLAHHFCDLTRIKPLKAPYKNSITREQMCLWHVRVLINFREGLFPGDPPYEERVAFLSQF